MKISEEIWSEINCLQEKESQDFLRELIIFENSIVSKPMPQYQDKITKIISKFITEEEVAQEEPKEEVNDAKN